MRARAAKSDHRRNGQSRSASGSRSCCQPVMQSCTQCGHAWPITTAMMHAYMPWHGGESRHRTGHDEVALEVPQIRLLLGHHGEVAHHI